MRDRRPATLTKRAQEVPGKLLAGTISRQIAGEPGISTRTVEAHRQNLLREPGIGSVKALMLHPIARDKVELASRQTTLKAIGFHIARAGSPTYVIYVVDRMFFRSDSY